MAWHRALLLSPFVRAGLFHGLLHLRLESSSNARLRFLKVSLCGGIGYLAGGQYLANFRLDLRQARARQVVPSSGGRGRGCEAGENGEASGGGGGGAGRSISRMSSFNCSLWRLRRRLEIFAAPVSSSDQIEAFSWLNRSAIVNGFSFGANRSSLS